MISKMSESTREELERRIDGLARQYAKTHDPKIKTEIEELSLLLAKWNETLH